MKQTSKKKNRGRKRRGILKQLLPYLAIILVAACLIVAVIFVTGRRGIDNRRTLSAVELDKTRSTDIGEQRMEKDSNPSIADLVYRYFQAVKVADADALAEIVETDAPIDAKSLEYKAEYIESYSNISCYTIPGIVDGTYIVYIYYEIKFLNIDTKAPTLVRFYICENDDGSMYINFRKQDGEVLAYMQEVAGWQEVRDLATEVNVKAEEAYSSDENLKAFKDMLEGNTTSQTKETMSAEKGSAEETSADGV